MAKKGYMGDGAIFIFIIVFAFGAAGAFWVYGHYFTLPSKLITECTGLCIEKNMTIHGVPQYSDYDYLCACISEDHETIKHFRLPINKTTYNIGDIFEEAKP
jgi:hypothetical protein